jgi:hypothetical protein
MVLAKRFTDQGMFCHKDEYLCLNSLIKRKNIHIPYQLELYPNFKKVSIDIFTKVKYCTN